MAVAVQRRNISKTITFDRERLDALDGLARGFGLSLSAAVSKLIDMHAGKLMDGLETRVDMPLVEVSRSRSRRLTGALISELAGAVRDGSTRADAYRLCELSPDAGRRWEKRGLDDIKAERSSLHADLVVTLERARAEFNAELIQEARRTGDYKTLLKLIDPEQFALPSRSEVDVTHRLQVQINWDALSIEETKTLALLLRKGTPAEEDRLPRTKALPSGEIIPPDVVEVLDAEDGEWTEAPALEAPALEGEKPQH